VLNRYLVHIRNAAQRWFNFHNVGLSPHRRAYHTMGSDGTRIFVLGGCSEGIWSDEISLIHVFDTSMYFRSLLLSGHPPRSRAQTTSSTRNPSVTLSILMRRPPNLWGSHPQVPRPRSNHRIRNLLHRKSTVLPICKTLPPLYRGALPLCRLLTSETPFRMVGHSRV
jgi:Kelch motif